MNARDWLHLIGIHHWGKWSEVRVIGTKTPSYLTVTIWGFEKPSVSDIVGQDRHCLICNEKQVREIEIK